MEQFHNVIASPLPFSNKQTAFRIPFGANLEEIYKSVVPTQFAERSDIGAIMIINGESIPKEYWASVKPKQGTFINVRIVPTGGGGKKNPLSTLLSIAVMVAAPYVGTALAGAAGFGGFWLGPTIGGTFLSSAFVYSTAFSVLGRLAISALSPPPKSSSSNNGGLLSNPAESRTQFIEGASNGLNPYSVVPICLGTNRVVPPQGARPYTETYNNEQYVRQIFTWSIGSKIALSDLRIGETPLDEFNDYDIEHKLNGDLNDGTSIYSNDVFQEELSAKIAAADGFILKTTQNDVDEAIVDITFPNGLVEYNTNAQRIPRNVVCEIQYAKTGESPQVWSAGAVSYKEVGAQTVTIPFVVDGGPSYPKYRKDYIYIDKSSGLVGVVRGQGWGVYITNPTVPTNGIKIADVNVVTTQNDMTGAITTTFTVSDSRQPSLFGTKFDDQFAFVASALNSTTVSISSGGLQNSELDIVASQKEALRKSIRLVFPEKAQYDIRIRRITPDVSSDQIFDETFLTAIKSIKYSKPVIADNVNGTAIRFKATDQTNGALSQFNGLVSLIIPDYDYITETWVERATSNPASLYRYVLQGEANARPLDDSKINIPDFVDWHNHCRINGYTYNRVVDYDTSISDVLKDIASAGAATPAIVDGKRTIAIDRVKEAVGMITARNVNGYNGEIIYPDLPHGFRVTFRNAEKDYIQDQIIVYDDGYNESNATIFETLDLQSCTNAELAFKTARRHLASARLRPESHSFNMDIENIVFLRGDRVKFTHDIPIVGIGDGRIKEIYYDASSPRNITGFALDDTIAIPSNGSYFVRIRTNDGIMYYKELVSSQGEFTSFDFIVPFADDGTLEVGNLLYVVEAGGEKDLVITRIEYQQDFMARVYALDYNEAIFDAENSAIPAFESKITTPLEFIRPNAPILVSSQSDETAMIRNSDGSYLSRAIFTLENTNEGNITPIVKIKLSGTDNFINANTLELSAERIVITGLEDGARYDIHIRYERAGSSVFSPALQINSYLFVGASTKPAAVNNFRISVSDNTALFTWDYNTEIDISHYVLRFSNLYSGATWGTSQLVVTEERGNSVSLPFIGGTYLIKAVDILGNESDTATAIITYNPTGVANAVADIIENPSFAGVKDNVAYLESTDSITLQDPAVVGYYYFDNMVDLTGVYTSFISASIIANGTYVNNLFALDDLFTSEDIFGQGGIDLFALDDLFTSEDIFGIGSDAWEVELEYRTTNEDPNNSPVDWSDWQTFQAGTVSFWAIQFRIKLISLAQNISPEITELSVRVDMPDRIERGSDLTVTPSGYTINFLPEFKETPAVAITIQNGATDDKIEVVSKDSGSYNFKVYNATTAGYVTRTFDFIASGYGRKN